MVTLIIRESRSETTAHSVSHYVYKENANVIKYLTNVGSAVIGAARIYYGQGE